MLLFVVFAVKGKFVAALANGLEASSHTNPNSRKRDAIEHGGHLPLPKSPFGSPVSSEETCVSPFDYHIYLFGSSIHSEKYINERVIHVFL